VTTEFNFDAAVESAARTQARIYRRWVELEDVRQELWMYALGDGKRHINKWIVDDEIHRVILALLGAAKQYCETEKATKSGYHFEDIAWYAPEALADLIPFALDPEFDGITGDTSDQSGIRKQTDGREGGTILAMIADTRRGLQKMGRYWQVEDFDPLSESGMQNLVTLADHLGGEFPNSPGYQRGRRRVLSNAAAAVEIRRGSGEL
jgi:hypothetical protein